VSLIVRFAICLVSGLLFFPAFKSSCDEFSLLSKRNKFYHYGICKYYIGEQLSFMRRRGSYQKRMLYVESVSGYYEKVHYKYLTRAQINSLKTYKSQNYESYILKDGDRMYYITSERLISLSFYKAILLALISASAFSIFVIQCRKLAKFA
jgi:hypothetical protein